MVGSEIERYRKAIPKLKTLRRKLLYCFELWSMGGFRLTATHPETTANAHSLTLGCAHSLFQKD